MKDDILQKKITELNETNKMLMDRILYLNVRLGYIEGYLHSKFDMEMFDLKTEKDREN